MRRTGKHRPRIPRHSRAPIATVESHAHEGIGHASGEQELHVPLTLPRSPSVKVAPEPLVEETEPPDAGPSDVDEHEDVALRARRDRSRRIAHIAILASSVVCAIALVNALVRWEMGSADAAAPRLVEPIATSARPPVPVTTVAPTPTVAPSSSVAIAPPTAGRMTDRDAARAERLEAQTALEIGDLRRASIVAQHAVEHDPSEADGWLLLVAARLELHDTNGAHRALAACRDQATRGPRGECVALIETTAP